jgi:hypothetical protein
MIVVNTNKLKLEKENNAHNGDNSSVRRRRLTSAVFASTTLKYSFVVVYVST